MSDLNGKTWFITGTSTGLGRAIANEVIQRGGQVVASAREPASIADLLALAPERVLATQLDVTRPQEIDAAVAAARERFGTVDVLVNNAGYALMSAIEEASDAEVRHQFDVNVFGLAAVTRAVLPAMRAVGSGHIVNISSIQATRPSPGLGYYSATKCAVEAISECLSRELEDFGIRMLIVELGPFRTDFSARSIGMPARSIFAYQSVAQLRASYRSVDGAQPGDPKRAARIIVDTVRSDDPPLRLILGASTFTRAFEATRDRLADVGRSREVAPLADFPPAEAVKRVP